MKSATFTGIAIGSLIGAVFAAYLMRDTPIVFGYYSVISIVTAILSVTFSIKEQQPRPAP